jgi:heat shock protein HslJ
MKRLALLLLPLAAACAVPTDHSGAGAAAPAAPALTGTRWIGVIDAGLDPGLAPRLEFIAGHLQGFTGCNLMSGSWRVEGNEVRFGAIAATKRACMGPGGEIEKRVLAAMGDRSRVRRDGERLVIEAPGGARFEFRLSRP